VLAPKTVRRGADYTVSVNILHASRDVRVRTELRDANNDMLVSNTTTVASGDGCIKQLLMFTLGSLLLMRSSIA